MRKKKDLGELITDNKENAEELSTADKKVASDKDKIENKISKLILENKENALSLSAAYKLIATQKKEIKKKAADLIRANKEKEKRRTDLISAKQELMLAKEKAKHTAKLIILNKELTIQITEHKQSEKALLESEERFQLLFNKAPLGYQSLDIDGKQWLDTLGYIRDEVIGKWFGDFLSPAYQDGFRKRFPIFKAQGYIHSEFEMVHKNGNKLFIAFEGKIGYDANGEFKQTHCILQDITEVKKAQEETVRQKELLQRIIDNLPVMITYFDNNRKILLTNNELTKVLGWTPNEWETENIFAKCYPDPKYMKEVLDFMNSGDSGWQDSRTNTKYGTVIDTSWTNIKLADGVSMGIGQDITERKNNESKLIENEEFTRRIIDSRNDCIKVLDLEGNLLSMSAGGQKLLEIDDITVYLKKSWIDFWKGKDREGAVEAVSKAKKGDIGFFTGYSPTEKSNPKWWEIVVSPIKDSDGNIHNLLAVSRDITNRIKSEEKLQHAYVFNETLLKTIPFGMDIVDETGTVIFQSDNFKEIFGENAIGKKCWILYRDDKKQCSDCPLNKGITIGETEAYESHGVLGNRIFEISHTGMMFQGKKAMLEIFQDITERKQAEKKLKGSEYELKRAQEITHIGSWHLEVATNEVVWTEELYKMYGFNPALPPPPYTEHMKLFTPESWELLSTSLAKTTETGIPYELELQTVMKDGSNGWMWVRGEAQKDSNGKIVGLWGAAQKITDRKVIEHKLIEAKEKAEESDRLKSAFLANMSHEIRTPMNGILGFTELLKEPNLSTDDQQDFIQTIQISGERMLNTINNIVDVSKIESGLINLVIDETKY